MGVGTQSRQDPTESRAAIAVSSACIFIRRAGLNFNPEYVLVRYPYDPRPPVHYMYNEGTSTEIEKIGRR